MPHPELVRSRKRTSLVCRYGPPAEGNNFSQVCLHVVDESDEVHFAVFGGRIHGRPRAGGLAAAAVKEIGAEEETQNNYDQSSPESQVGAAKAPKIESSAAFGATIFDV